MLSDVQAVPKLLDVGLAARYPVQGDLAVGSIRYKDPLVYIENCWAPTNDLFSVFLVLYELLTGTHPFGGGPPEPNQHPTIQREEFPDSYHPSAVDRLATLFTRALSPVAAERPKGTAAAIKAVEDALGISTPQDSKPGTLLGSVQPDSVPPPPLPTAIELGTPLVDIELSTRAQGALARLGLTVVADLVGFDANSVRGLPNIGSKTIRELRALAAAIESRWPNQPKADRAPTERFYPALAEDVRPLDALGGELTHAVKESLTARGVFSIGDLAAMPPSDLSDCLRSVQESSGAYARHCGDWRDANTCPRL